MSIKIYTDGSCSLNNKNDLSLENKGGWGCVVTDGFQVLHQTYKAFKNTTNNRMELSAVLYAMQYMTENHPDESYTICVDSAYIANCFAQEWYKKWQANGYRTAKRTAVENVDIWKPIIHLYRSHKDSITIEKVAGHADNEYNNMADSLANEWRGLLDEDFSIDQKPSR